MKRVAAIIGSAAMLVTMLGIAGCDDAQTASAKPVEHQRVVLYHSTTGAYMGSIEGECSSGPGAVNSVKADIRGMPAKYNAELMGLPVRKRLLAVLCGTDGAELFPGEYVAVRD